TAQVTLSYAVWLRDPSQADTQPPTGSGRTLPVVRGTSAARRPALGAYQPAAAKRRHPTDRGVSNRTEPEAASRRRWDVRYGSESSKVRPAKHRKTTGCAAASSWTGAGEEGLGCAVPAAAGPAIPATDDTSMRAARSAVHSRVKARVMSGRPRRIPGWPRD